MLTEACPGAKSSGCRLHQRLLWGYHLHQCEWDTEAVHFQSVIVFMEKALEKDNDIGRLEIWILVAPPSTASVDELKTSLMFAWDRGFHIRRKRKSAPRMWTSVRSLLPGYFLHKVMEGFAQSATSIWLRFQLQRSFAVLSFKAVIGMLWDWFHVTVIRIRLVGHTVTRDSRRILSVQTGGIHPRNSFLLFQWRSHDLRFQLQLQRSCGAVSGLWVLRVAESESDVDNHSARTLLWHVPVVAVVPVCHSLWRRKWHSRWRHRWQGNVFLLGKDEIRLVGHDVGTSFAPGLSSEGAPRNRLNMRWLETGIVTSRPDLGHRHPVWESALSAAAKSGQPVMQKKQRPQRMDVSAPRLDTKNVEDAKRLGEPSQLSCCFPSFPWRFEWRPVPRTLTPSSLVTWAVEIGLHW